MYDLPELRTATDRLWQAIASRLPGIAAPAALTRDRDLHAVWTDPDLLLAQTCGYPLATRLQGRVTLVATPCYAAQGCEGPLYRSAIVVRADDPAGSLAGLRGRRAAVNAPDSQSGMNALRAEVAPLAQGGRFFAGVVPTGAHAASLEAVAGRRADVAAIDCVTWALLQRVRPQATRGLRVLGWTAPAPGLPLVTSRCTAPETLRRLVAALDEVAADPTLAAVRGDLLLQGFAVLPVRAYDRLVEAERAAVSAAYPALA